MKKKDLTKTDELLAVVFYEKELSCIHERRAVHLVYLAKLELHVFIRPAVREVAVIFFI